MALIYFCWATLFHMAPNSILYHLRHLRQRSINNAIPITETKFLINQHCYFEQKRRTECRMTWKNICRSTCSTQAFCIRPTQSSSGKKSDKVTKAVRYSLMMSFSFLLHKRSCRGWQQRYSTSASVIDCLEMILECDDGQWAHC